LIYCLIGRSSTLRFALLPQVGKRFEPFEEVRKTRPKGNPMRGKNCPAEFKLVWQVVNAEKRS
jgi:hypothetical protein